jgi:hypothetical protein
MKLCWSRLWFGRSGEDINLSPIPAWQAVVHSLYRLRYPESESRVYYYEVMVDLGLCLELIFLLLQNEMALASDVLIHAMLRHSMYRQEGLAALGRGSLKPEPTQHNSQDRLQIRK